MSRWHGIRMKLRHFVVRAAIQEPAGGCFANTTPLLEEESDSVATTNLANVFHPAFLHWACPCAAFTAHDCPVDAGNLKLSEVFEKRLDGQKFDRRGRGTKMFDSG